MTTSTLVSGAQQPSGTLGAPAILAQGQTIHPWFTLTVTGTGAVFAVGEVAGSNDGVQFFPVAEFMAQGTTSKTENFGNGQARWIVPFSQYAGRISSLSPGATASITMTS